MMAFPEAEREELAHQVELGAARTHRAVGERLTRIVDGTAGLGQVPDLFTSSLTGLRIADYGYSVAAAIRKGEPVPVPQ